MKMFLSYIATLCCLSYGAYEMISYIMNKAGDKAFLWLFLPFVVIYLYIKLISKKGSASPFFTFWTGFIGYISLFFYKSEVVEYLNYYGYQTAFAIVFVIVSTFFLLLHGVKLDDQKKAIAKVEKERKEQEFKDRVLSFIVSDNINDYESSYDHFERNTPEEREYRKKHLLTLLGLFDNCCANCYESTNGLDLDHFIFPKYHGGNFMMVHKDGFKVNNAIPLCQSCNRSKGKRHYRNFFTEEQLLEILEKNKRMTEILNGI